MKDIYAWAAIGLIILASTTGDVLLSYSMKRVGDVGELWKRRGVLEGSNCPPVARRLGACSQRPHLLSA